MRAVTLSSYGDTSVLRLSEVPEPQLKSGQVLIEVSATGVNRADISQRQGNYPPPPGESEILGLEVAGKVLQVADGVAAWKPGDRVMALLAGGGYAERVCADAKTILPIPEHWSDVVAAAALEAYLTAFQNIFRIAGLCEGQCILVHAGASGVGLAVLQLVKGIASKVFATVGTDQKAESVAQLGAIPIRYKTEDFLETVRIQTEGRGVDLILDPVGASYLDRNTEALAVDGTQILIGLLGGSRSTIDLSKILLKRIHLIGSTLRSLPITEKRNIVDEFWSKFSCKIEQGVIAPIIDSKFDITDVAQAHTRMESNQNIGKIVLIWN